MTAQLRRAVFLDRDGVLNRAICENGKSRPPRNLAELEIPTGVAEALCALRAAGFLLIGVTNQPDVARGETPRHLVEAINAQLQAQLPLDEIRVCYHDDADQCACRKPQPGMLLQAAAQSAIDLSRSFMIGDRWKDIEAGRRAGCRTIWLEPPTSEPWHGAPPTHRVASLREAAAWILARVAGEAYDVELTDYH